MQSDRVEVVSVRLGRETETDGLDTARDGECISARI